MPNPDWTYKEFRRCVMPFAKSGWFKMHWAFIKPLGLEPAATLQILINCHDSLIRRSKGYSWNEGWFYFTCKRGEEKIGVSAYSQNRLLKKLENAGCIETKKTGCPPRRHVRINPKKIEEMHAAWIEREKKRACDKRAKDKESSVIDDLESLAIDDLESSVNHTKVDYTKVDDIKVEGGTKVPARKSSSLFDEEPRRTKKRKPHLSDFDRKAAAELRVLFVKKEVARLDRAKIDSIGQQIYRLRQKGTSEERIKKVVIWWKRHYGEEYVPRIWKLTDVFDKFGRTEDQIEIKQREGTRINGKNITHDNMYDNENCVNGVPRIWVTQDGRRFDGVLLHEVRNRVRDRFGNGLPLQSQVNEVLESMDRATGSISRDVVGRVG